MGSASVGSLELIGDRYQDGAVTASLLIGDRCWAGCNLKRAAGTHRGPFLTHERVHMSLYPWLGRGSKRSRRLMA